MTVLEGDAAIGTVVGEENDDELVSSVIDVVVAGRNTTSGLSHVTASLRLSPVANTIGGGVCSIPTLVGVIFKGQATDDSCTSGCCEAGDPDAFKCDDPLPTGPSIRFAFESTRL